MPELKASVKSKNWHWALGAFGGGAGVTIAIFAIKALKERPEFLPQLLSSGVLGFAALVVGMVMFQKQFVIFNVVHERNVVAQEQLAAGVNALVAKDDRRAEAQEAATRFLAGRTDLILEKLTTIDARLSK
jgi:hypothetical protein